MYIIGLAAVKNEEDIIEIFIRHNFNFLDEIHILDNGSTDNTLVILQKLMSEGFNIKINHSDHRAYDQGKTLTFYSHLLKHADFLIPLDADEFIFAKDRQFFIEQLMSAPNGLPLRVEWKTYVPHKVKNDGNFLSEINYRRRVEELEYGKVFLPKAYIGQSHIALGNHFLSDSNGQRLKMHELTEVTLAHYPIRNDEQIIAKSILGAYAFQMCQDNKTGQASHWGEIANFIRQNNYEISDQFLHDLALNYANVKPRINKDIVYDPLVRFENVYVKYKDLQKSSILKKMDGMLDKLVNKIIHLESQNEK